MKPFDKLTKILLELSGIEAIILENKLQGDLGLDSIQMVTLLIVIEETFNIVLDESDMNPFDLITVSDVLELVEKYLGGGNDGVEE